jgi:predicted RNase H-like HicB family nuclease
MCICVGTWKDLRASIVPTKIIECDILTSVTAISMNHPSRTAMKGLRSMLKVETEREEDGRWIAEVAALPGVMTYGATRAEAVSKAEALALRVLADRVEHGEAVPELEVRLIRK